MEPRTPVDGRIRELFVAHGPALLLYARQWLDLPAAQDVVQDVFVRLIAGRRLPAEPRKVEDQVKAAEARNRAAVQGKAK